MPESYQTCSVEAPETFYCQIGKWSSKNRLIFIFGKKKAGKENPDLAPQPHYSIYFVFIIYTAASATRPPAIVEALGDSLKNIHEKTTALDGTRKTNEAALYEPVRWEAKK